MTIQTTTLRSLGDSYREVEAAGAARQPDGRRDRRADRRAGPARGASSRHAVDAAIRRDRHILNLGGAHASKVEQGLEAAQQVEDQEANTAKIYIPNGLLDPVGDRRTRRRPRVSNSPVAAGGRRTPSSRSSITSAINWPRDHRVPVRNERPPLYLKRLLPGKWQKVSDYSKDSGSADSTPEGAATGQPRATPWDR